MVQSEQTERLINNPAFLPLTEQADDGGRVWMGRHGDQDGGDDLALGWTHVDPRDRKPTGSNYLCVYITQSVSA